MKIRLLCYIPAALTALFVLACSASEPPEELAVEGVFVPAEETPSNVVMHRGGPTRTGFYDTTGVLEEPEVRWTFQTDRRVATSPAVLADRVVFGSDAGTLYALDLETGQQLWEFDAGRQIRSSPLVVDGVVYFGTGVGTLYAVDVGTGEELWNFEADGGIPGSPVVAGGTVYFGTLVGSFYAVDARTGFMTWKKDLTGDHTSVESYSSPALFADTVYLVTLLSPSSNNSALNAISQQSGDVAWSLEIDGYVLYAPAFADGTVVISAQGLSIDGWVYAIDLETQQPRWVYKTERKKTWIQTAPTIADGLVLFGDSEARLTALNFDTGDVEWRFESEVDFVTSLTVADQLVYFGDVNGAIVAVDLVTGTERWRFQTDLDRWAPADCSRWIYICGTHSITIDSGSLYAGNHAGNFYALEARSSDGQ